MLRGLVGAGKMKAPSMQAVSRLWMRGICFGACFAGALAGALVLASNFILFLNMFEYV